jgi:SAM-dependent methyltransferase
MDSLTDAFYARHAEAIAAGAEATQSAVSRHFDAVFPQPGRVLDVGAGSGRDMAELARRGHAAYGLEPSAALRALAAERHPSLAARLRDASLPELGTPFADEVPAGGFDGLVCSAVRMPRWPRCGGNCGPAGAGCCAGRPWHRSSCRPGATQTGGCSRTTSPSG